MPWIGLRIDCINISLFGLKVQLKQHAPVRLGLVWHFIAETLRPDP
jgi:hypothetical protein